MSKKIIYFTVEKELINSLDDNSNVQETTGNKTVSAYSINNTLNKLEPIVSLDILNEENSIEAIQNYLDDNGMGDDEFEIILL